MERPRVRSTRSLSCFALVLALFARNTVAQPSCPKVDKIVLQEYVGQIHNIIGWVGMQKGIFEKHCLSASFQNYASAPAALAASIQGGLTYMSVSPESAYTAVAQGFDLKLVAYQNSAVNYALVVGKNVPLPHLKDPFPAVMKDLVGKKVGVNGMGSTSDAMSRYDFMIAGVGPEKETWIAYGPLAAGIAGLQNGTLDVAAFFADGMDVAAAATGGTIVADFRDPVVKRATPSVADMSVHLMWAAQTSYVMHNQDAVRRFFEANNEAIDWIKDPKHFDAVVELVKKGSPLPPGIPDPDKVYEERTKKYIATEDKHGTMAGLRAWNDWDVRMKRIPKPVDLDKILWETARSVTAP